VSDLTEIHGVDDLIVSVLLVPIEIFGLATVPCAWLAMLYATDQPSGVGSPE
jgi:hypothetical protein